MAENQNNRSREQCIALRSQGYSQRKIAEILGVSQSTVRFHTRHLPAVKKPNLSRTVRQAATPPSPLLPYGGNYWYCAFVGKVPGVVDAFERAVVYLGYEFQRQGEHRFRLSNSQQVRRLVDELRITKLREYRYETKQ